MTRCANKKRDNRNRMMKKIKLTRYPLTALAVVVIWMLCLIPIP